MLNRLPRVARSSHTLLSSSSRLPLCTRSRTPLRLASTHPTSHDAKHDDHGHGGHDDHFDPPGGWLWGQRPGEKYEKEGWEGLAWVFVASWVVAVAAYTMKEDTSYVALFSAFSCAIFRVNGQDHIYQIRRSLIFPKVPHSYLVRGVATTDVPNARFADGFDRIQTWALEEARRRLENEGFYDESK